MTFPELRATIAAEMPPGWEFRLHCDYWTKHNEEDWLLAVWMSEYRTTTVRTATPEALLSAWRGMREKLG